MPSVTYRKTIRTLITAFVCITGICITPLSFADDQNILSASRDQSIASMQVIEQLSRRHFLKIEINDALSERLYDNYLQHLDSTRNVLLASDIKEFEQYKLSFDDSLKKGELDKAFIIFNRYRSSLIERLSQLIKNLEDPEFKFNWDLNETIMLEPENADWPETAADANDRWRKRAKASVLSLILSSKPEKDAIELVAKRFKNQLNRVKSLKAEDGFQIYMNSLTKLYDPHTNYLSPISSENFNINMSLSLEGIGAVLQGDMEYTKVVRLVHAGPADKQGDLKPADKIIGVGQGVEGDIVDVIGWRLDDVVQLIRGPKDSIVRLEVLSGTGTTSAPKIISIKRDRVKLEDQAAEKRTLNIDRNGKTHRVGVIDVPTFYIDFEALRRSDPNYKSTTRDVRKLLNELVAENVEGIIIDLRDNGGGSLREAKELTGLFIDYGPVVQIKDPQGRVRREQKLPQNGFYQGPVVVLVNRLSASASEIFAAALQDYDRAIIIGGQTFGKGTVQSLTPLKHGQLKLTESKFYRISGDSTQHRGVVPDIQLPVTYDGSIVGESSLDDALAWDTIKPVKHRKYFDLKAATSAVSAASIMRTQKDPDIVYVTEQFAYMQQLRNRKDLSLNKLAREAEQKAQDETLLAFENSRRKSKGMELLKSLEKPDEEDSAVEEEESEDSKSLSDAYLYEAANILLDAKPFYQ